MKNKKLSIIIILLIILAITSFFRLWQLSAIPPGLYPDVAMNGNDALEALKTGNFKVFYPENNGREGLFINLIALSFSIFGSSIWSMKIVAAIFGIFAVLGLYLVTKEIFLNTALEAKAESIALLSSFFLAVSFWHTLFSRIGFRAIMVPFILVFGIYFLLKGFRTKKLSDFIIAGIFWGAGFYTYIAFRMAVIILAAIFFLKIIDYFKNNKPEIRWSWWWDKMLIQDGWWKVKILLLVIFLVVLPIGIYFLQHPQDFIGRAAGVSVFQQQNPIKSFFLSLTIHLGMFNFHGDGNWRHNFTGSPMLPWSVGILFLIGFFLSINYLIKSIKIKDYSLFTIFCLLFAWFFAMLLPGVLTYEGIPHALRVVGVIPIVYIFAALGGWWAYEQLYKIMKNRRLLLIICLLFLVAVSLSEFHKYFFSWAKNTNVEGAYTKKFADIGYYLNSLPQDYKKYVIVNEPGVPVPWPNGIPMPAQTPMFIEATKFGQPRAVYLLPESLDQIKIEKGTNVILLMKYEAGVFNRLKEIFPQGQIQEKEGIWLYQINSS
jgi:4-amino-4-deoxy-L-arabinose transferase-like glycosyltransferase